MEKIEKSTNLLLMLIQEIEKLTGSMEGFLSQNGRNLMEGEVLFHLARALPPNAIAVEIGSWKGKSTTWLGKGIESSKRGGIRLFAIDPHVGSAEHQKGQEKVDTFPDFQKNMVLAGLQKLVVPLRMTSVEGEKHIQDKIDFVFIDGAHDYDSVKLDFDTWFPKVKIGGIIAFHDSFLGWPGVQKVVDRQVFFSNCFKKIRYFNSITYATKCERISFFERLENYLVYGVKKIHMFSLHVPQPFKSLMKKWIWKPFEKSWRKEINK